MKFCAIICEYNPLHNGHAYQIQEAKRRSGADAILCVMSGNFVQRGESAILDKFTRARHAVRAGADAVVELPTLFATSNAELFAKGGVKLLSYIPAVQTLCFGAEGADKDFLAIADLLNDEPAAVSEEIKNGLKAGLSYAKAREKAWSGRIPDGFLSSPNNILGIEYARAIRSLNASVIPLPIQRIGSGYSDKILRENYSSASAIRATILQKQPLNGSLPDYVQSDLPKQLENKLDGLEKYAILQKTPEEIARVCDCTEGLENAFKKAAKQNAPLTETLTSARYTSSRIRRIALQNLLNIEETLVRRALSESLYLRVLALNKQKKELLSYLRESGLPVIVRAHDEKILDGVAAECYARDTFAESVYSLLYEQEKTGKDIFL